MSAEGEEPGRATRPVQIRPVRLDDAPGLAARQSASWPIEFVEIVPAHRLAQFDAGRSTSVMVRFLEGALEAGTATRWLVAAAGDDIRGEIRFGPPADDDVDGATTGEVGVLGVHPDHWRQGVGTALMRAAEETMRAAGLVEVVLWVLEPNDRGRRFYEAIGYRPDGARRMHEGGPPPLFGVDVPEVRYRRRIAEG